MSKIRPPYCDLRIGQRVTVTGKYSDEWRGEYVVTRMSWEFARGSGRDFNIAIASDEEIERRYGDTDGWGLNDLSPVAHPTDNASASPSEGVMS